MLRRGISVLGLMALILSLDARSLYRRKRWTHYPSQSSDISDGLRELELQKSNVVDNARYGYYEPNDSDFDRDAFGSSPQETKYPSLASYAIPADLAELRDILEPDSNSDLDADLEGEESIDPVDMADMLEAEEDEVTPEPVSKAELEDIFSTGDNDKKKKSVIKKRTDPNEEETREWLMDHFFQNEDTKERVDKKKRQTSTEVDGVEVLAMENRLLEKENEFLAGALNAATMGQMDHTDKHMKEQYDYLKKAVAIEEALQSINGPMGDDGEAEEEERMEEKKAKRFPVKKNDDDDTTGYSGINPLLRQLVHEYDGEEEGIKRKRQDPEMDMENIMPVETPGIATSPVVLSDQNADPDNEESLTENLQTMVSNLTPRQRHIMEGEVNTLLDSGLLDNKCPAVASVADDCERMMRKFSVDLDEQAKDVCNRHKVCYSCGSSIDPQKTLNRDSCDRIFMEQTKALCGGDGQCKESALGLFVLMKRSHMYIDWPSPVTAELCSEKCVVEFLLNGQ